ncbi:HEXXH motif-containing putative peptide modification protein [Dactylosporangium sp. NPDC005555]|uniref:aKG-HExxH-type peptide beta-hydroxylase n=1 Tax=Dactylosporangium sp. NPDC005555 TaxID=3154889 RepID=UPI0033AAFD43
MDRISITAADLAAIAAGTASPALVQVLHRAQHSKSKLMFRLALRAQERHPGFALAARTLLDAEAAAPAAIAELLREPFIGVWAGRCVERPLDPAVLATMQGLAVAAAMRAGLTVDVPITAVHGQVVLPATGALTLPEYGRGPMTAKIVGGRCELGGVTMTVDADFHAGRDGGSWRYRRRIRAVSADCVLDVAVEDQDPVRDCYGMPVSDPLSHADRRHWSAQIAGAWDLLVAFHPQPATEIGEYLKVLVPLADRVGDASLSATSRDAYGAVALTAPADSTTLAVALLHERQHALCNAVLDLVPLVRTGGQARYFAPWRRDARPADGLLHGTVAFFGVADGWAGFLQYPPAQRLAEQALADTREQLMVAMDQLESAPEITRWGRTFVAGLRSRVRPLMDIELPAVAVDRARQRLADRHMQWRELTRS